MTVAEALQSNLPVDTVMLSHAGLLLRAADTR